MGKGVKLSPDAGAVGKKPHEHEHDHHAHGVGIEYVEYVFGQNFIGGFRHH